MSHLTIAYITCRKYSRVRWFLDSLHRECGDSCQASPCGCGVDAIAFPGITVLVIDFWERARAKGQVPGSVYPPGSKAEDSWFMDGWIDATYDVKWEQPKPTPWQGPHRLTKENWFAAASQRNTALCHAPDGWIAYVDDLSVLLPGWLSRVRKAMADNYIVFGAYKKAKELVVENGEVKSFKEYPGGSDNRLKYCSELSPCEGKWLYGCSLAAPVEALLSVNGWPEDLCDGLGFEDCCMGIALQNAGHNLRYDPKMMTYESEELHHVEPSFRKEDWHFEDGKPVTGGNGGNDKSHAALNIAMQSKWFPNSIGNMREVRQKVLAGEPFPVNQNPRHEWYTKVPLGDL